MWFPFLNCSKFLHKKPFVAIPLFILLLFGVQLSNATTVIPFVNLGEMALASDEVVVAKAVNNYELHIGQSTKFRTSFIVTKSIKGILSKGESFELQAWHEKVGNTEQVIWGDPKFIAEKKYLLFLSQTQVEPYWQPMMLAYGIFEQTNYSGDVLFVPSKESFEIEAVPRPDGIVPEPMVVYHASSLMKHLSDYISSSSAWEGNKAKANDEVNTIYQSQKAAPSHCTFLESLGGTPFRYTGFPSDDIELFSEDDGDSSIGAPNDPDDAHDQVENAMNDMETSYAGINWTYSGTKDFTPDCTGGKAQNGNFNTVIGSRQAIVIYNDPCNQIDDLVSCSGTLAIGGLRSSGTHTYDGITWNSGNKSFVVVNNGTGGCLSLTNYKIMLTHELSHCLGIGHIDDPDPPDDTANMNPSCCTNITNLDEQCLDYTYAPLLPVELIGFTAQKQTRSVFLNWSTASEKNNAYFLLEKSVDGKAFETIGQVSGAGNSQTTLNYSFIDEQPRAGTNYYRLKQVDFNGDFEYSNIRSVFMEIEGGYFSVYPNPAHGNLLNVVFSSKNEIEVEVELIDVEGKVLVHHSRFLERGMNKMQVPMDRLVPGVYCVRLNSSENVYVERIVKM